MDTTIRGVRFQLLGVVVATALTSCGVSEPEAVDDTTQLVIGGYHADNAVLDHTGLIVAYTPDGQVYEPLCSGTLVGPETLLTAKHCLEVFAIADAYGWRAGFATGGDGLQPKELAEIVSFVSIPPESGGFNELGADVAVMHLDRAPQGNIEFAQPRHSSGLKVGRVMTTLGYGVFGAQGAIDAQRRIGRETVDALEGRTLQAIFGDFESFVEWVYTGELTDENILLVVGNEPAVAELSDLYESLMVLEGFEAITGHGLRDTQSCYGDSGSPLLALTRDGVWETYGVVSGGFGSLRSVCDFGSAFSTFGDDAFDVITTELTWVDPCGDVSRDGICDGDTLRYCETEPLFDVRALREVDCAAQGQQCVSDGLGAVCGSPAAVRASRPSTARRATAAIKAELERVVREGYLRDLGIELDWGL